MVQDLSELLQREQPTLAPYLVWDAHQQLTQTSAKRPKQELVALVSLVRHVCGLDETLTNYHTVVDKNFQDWTFKKQAGSLKFTPEQMDWLRLLKTHVATSFQVAIDDLDYTPFDAQGGRGRMYQLFGTEMDDIIGELNEVLAA